MPPVRKSTTQSYSLSAIPTMRGYQQEMLEASLRGNIIIALDTGSGKTLIAVLRIKYELETEATKISWFFAPTVALCQQQKKVMETYLPVSVGLVTGALEPNQWKNSSLWDHVLRTHRVVVSTPQVLLDALRHGYIILGRDISLLVFDEAHHAVDNHPYNSIMKEFYYRLPSPSRSRHSGASGALVRPNVLGLTASPIYGGNVTRAFQAIERNLDCTICAPQQNRKELASFVHQPIFKHVLYRPDDPSLLFSTNYASLCDLLSTLHIDNDPHTRSLRQQLAKLSPGTAEHRRLDQQLSKVVASENTFTHKGLRDFARTARDILGDLGPWAADWYVWKVVEMAKHAAHPYQNIMSNWKDEEKAYLRGLLQNLALSTVSYHVDDIVHNVSQKGSTLIDCLLHEKSSTEERDEAYSGLIFVQRRDMVIALSELLSHHPLTKMQFRVGGLIGTSESSNRHSFLDITRTILLRTQDDTIYDFRIGKKNLLVATSVAEEGLDIQACGSVIRWDPPPNIASWVQSRGRARRQRSTFTVMFNQNHFDKNEIRKWEKLESEMVSLYNATSREKWNADAELDDEAREDDMEFRVEETGALLTLQSALPSLAHFCAVIPNSVHVDNRPLYDTEPPLFVEAWHMLEHRSPDSMNLYEGPYGSRVTLPRCLPLPKREFVVDKIYPTRMSAHRHAAFAAYLSLYESGLLNNHLLPLTSAIDPNLEEEVQRIMADVEKRSSIANVSLQIDPWADGLTDSKHWWVSEVVLGDLPPLKLYTRTELPLMEDGPTLYQSHKAPIRSMIRPLEKVCDTDESIERARGYTRRLFWYFNGSRMKWDRTDYSYLVLPAHEADEDHWDQRRSSITGLSGTVDASSLSCNAHTFGVKFGYPKDLTIIKRDALSKKLYQFVRWRFEPLTQMEEEELRQQYSRFPDLTISYPLLVVRRLPARANFLVPSHSEAVDVLQSKHVYFLPQYCHVAMISNVEAQYAFLLPSVFRFLFLTLTVSSMRQDLFPKSSFLSTIPLHRLRTAMTAPCSGELSNYQRLETLGDTVLKFIVTIQVLAEYPLWHEGYLSRKKDHSVSNGRLAKENVEREMYRWIIRDRMLGNKWSPDYLTGPARVEQSGGKNHSDQIVATKERRPSRKGKQQLSTKVLADVVESLIGAAYVDGGYALGYECARFFGLGLTWQPISVCIEQIMGYVETDPDPCPSQLVDVEGLLGYTFKRKLLLIEALTHASSQQDLRSPSYERLEFLGDAILDMIVTDYIFRIPGKQYSAGQMHSRKSAVVNAHTLGFVCLQCARAVDASMPRLLGDGSIALASDTHMVHLWQFLQHSSARLLEDQFVASMRYRQHGEEIEDAFENGTLFPWAALMSLQAPKFLSDMVESMLGAVFLDAGGSLDAVRQVLCSLGIMRILERIVTNELDVLHPVSRISIWASKTRRRVEFKIWQEKGEVICAVLVDEKEEVRDSQLYRGKASEKAVKLAAAEGAIKLFGLCPRVNQESQDLKTGPEGTGLPLTQTTLVYHTS